MLRFPLAVVASLAFLASARAQLPQARLDRLFPLSGAAGSAVVVEVTGRGISFNALALYNRDPFGVFRAQRRRPGRRASALQS